MQKITQIPSQFSNFKKHQPSNTQNIQNPIKNSQNISKKLKLDLINIYRSANPDFTEVEYCLILTEPDEGIFNNGLDNKNNDLIVWKNKIFSNKNKEYKITKFLGSGTYGQVFECDDESNSDPNVNQYAIKIFKNDSKYVLSQQQEQQILKSLSDKQCLRIPKFYDFFQFENHNCMVMQLMDTSLADILTLSPQGYNFEYIAHWGRQILEGLAELKENRIINGDLKPENILISGVDAYICDFSTSFKCDQEPSYFYFQSRFYRAPEVILGLSNFQSIDIWGFGCILVELFTGKPLFVSQNQSHLLQRITDFCGLPSLEMLQQCRYSKNFFDMGVGITLKNPSKQQSNINSFKDLENYLIVSPYRIKLDLQLLKIQFQQFLDLVKQILVFDPMQRLTADQALTHEFFKHALQF